MISRLAYRGRSLDASKSPMYRGEDGHEYQDYNSANRDTFDIRAEIPQFIAYAPAPQVYEEEKAVKVWSPDNPIPEHLLDEYITKAKEKYSYNMEQALGMLCWHNFDLNRAYADIANFVPYPDDWTVEDKVLFEQAYQFHEKNFHKIKQMLPDKSMADLVKYYYNWKKTRTRASLMERQTKRFASRRQPGSDAASDSDQEVNQSTNDADGNNKVTGNGLDEAEESDESESEVEDGVCFMCSTNLKDSHGRLLQVIIDTMEGDACVPCYNKYWKEGKKRSNQEKPKTNESKKAPSKKILINRSDVESLADGSKNCAENMLKDIDSKIMDLKSHIQQNKQMVSQIKDKLKPISDQIDIITQSINVDDILPPKVTNSKWTTDEVEFLLLGLRRYGTDFETISDVLRTKTANHIRGFFAANRTRLNLQTLIDRYEEDNPSPMAIDQAENTPSE